MSRSTTYRVVTVVSGCVLLALTLPLMPGRLHIPRPSGESRDTTVSSKPTPYGSSATENSNQTVRQKFYVGTPSDILPGGVLYLTQLLIHVPITQVSLDVSKRRYLFFIELDEQLSQNTVKYLQLCYFSAVWNLSIVEPFIYSDTEWLSSLPPVSKDHNMLPYFDLYNTTEGLRTRVA